MPDNIYSFQYDQYGNTRAIVVKSKGLALYHDHYINKGTAFTEEERRRLGLDGALPPSPRPLAQQVKNSRAKVRDKEDDIERYIYIRSLFDRNVTLAHALIGSDIEQYMGIIYTPTVGLACERFSSIYRHANGLHFYPGNIERAEEILHRYVHRDIRVAVVTDNQGILGIGDQGVGGIAVCLGKLMLYTQGAGIAPWHCLPISLDVGTDNKSLLMDEDYLGWRHERLTGREYLRFVQRFAKAFRSVFPNAICQWEDFSRENAFAIRDAYLHDLISFNDDIQSTGAAALAAILTGMRIKKEALQDQVFVIAGTGSGAIGAAEQLETALAETGLSIRKARERIFVLENGTLLISDRSLPAYKGKFARDPATLPWFTSPDATTLLDVIKQTGTTVFLDFGDEKTPYGQEEMAALADNTSQPVVLCLKNSPPSPASLSEDILKWTQGRALIASGGSAHAIDHGGRHRRIGQCNNVFVFPGMGLGIIASGAKRVLPSFFHAAARAVSQTVTPEAMREGELMPPLPRLREVSLRVAQAVGESAVSANIGHLCSFSNYQHDNQVERLNILIDKMRWQPKYLPIFVESY